MPPSDFKYRAVFVAPPFFFAARLAIAAYWSFSQELSLRVKSNPLPALIGLIVVDSYAQKREKSSILVARSEKPTSGFASMIDNRMRPTSKLPRFARETGFNKGTFHFGGAMSG